MALTPEEKKRLEYLDSLFKRRRCSVVEYPFSDDQAMME